MGGKSRNRGLTALLVLASLAALVLLVSRGLPDGRLHVWFLDVGQGDAILIRTPDGHKVLVDGGPSPVVLLEQLGELLPFWDRRLDLVVLTHPDQDHSGGLTEVAERYLISRVLCTADAADGGNAQAWIGLLRQRAVPLVLARRGQTLSLGDVKMEVLHPTGAPAAGAAEDGNNNSIVLRLDFGLNSVLLTGDAEQAAEMDMLAGGVPLAAGVLKVGHHGSARSTTAAFLEGVNPQVAVIQVGSDNEYGQPNAQTLKRLRSIRVLRTDRHGRIEVIGDGSRLWIDTER